MAQEQVDIFETIAKGTVTLGELKSALSDAKKALDGMTVGEEQYQKQLKDVITLQNAVRGAMNGTTASLEDVAKAADGTSKTYNGLVNQMANMKRELRNIDVSTEEGAKAFEELAGKINAVNDELKAMDAMKGDFQRNVGNYQSAFKGWAGGADALDKGLKAATGGLGGFKGGMEALAANPAMATFGILVSVALKLAEGLKDNEAAMAGVKKAMDALKPVMDFFAGILETVGTYVGDLIAKAASFLSSNGIFQKVIGGVMGVGNAILQYVIAPFKGVIAAIKVFKEQGIKGLGDAAKAFGQEMKQGFSFKQNFQAGQTAADTIIDGMSSRKPKAKKAGKDLAKEAAEAAKKEMEKRVKEYAESQKMLAEHRKYLKKFRDETEKSIEEGIKDITAETDAMIEDYLAKVADEAEAERIIQEWSVKQAEEAAQKKLAAMNGYVSGSSELLSSLADLMEASGSEDEKNIKAVKNLRIAAATIDMIQGAVTAFSTAQQLGPIAGPIVGAINAAAVVASGLANIAKIRSTNVSKNSTPSTNAPDTPATVSAPALETAIPQTTVVEGASQEQRLNRAASPQKVYILQDDIEAADEASRVQVAESSF